MLLTPHAGYSKEKHLLCASKYLLYHFQVSSLFPVFNTSKQGRKRFCVITTEKTFENVSMLWIPAPVWGLVCFFPCRGISFPFAFAVFKLWPLWEKQWLKWKVRTNCIKPVCCQNMSMMNAVLGHYRAWAALHTQKIKIKKIKAGLFNFLKYLRPKRKGNSYFKKSKFPGLPFLQIGGVWMRVFVCVHVSVCLGRKERMGEEEGQITLLTY